MEKRGNPDLSKAGFLLFISYVLGSSVRIVGNISPTKILLKPVAIEINSLLIVADPQQVIQNPTNISIVDVISQSVVIVIQPILIQSEAIRILLNDPVWCHCAIGLN